MTSNPATPYALLTSLRYDPDEEDTFLAHGSMATSTASTATRHVWLFDLHLQRLRNAVSVHGWPKAAHLSAEEFLRSVVDSAGACHASTTDAADRSCKVGFPERFRHCLDNSKAGHTGSGIAAARWLAQCFCLFGA
jgi:hypothetical protein